MTSTDKQRTDKQRTDEQSNQTPADKKQDVPGRHRPAESKDAAMADAAREPTDATEPGQDVEAADSATPEKPALSAFAAAIERKRAVGQSRSAHLDGIAKVGGATSNHKTSRTFRRKSG